MARRQGRPDPKEAALAEARCLNPRGIQLSARRGTGYGDLAGPTGPSVAIASSWPTGEAVALQFRISLVGPNKAQSSIRRR
jgi:hypothetical protein